MREFLLGFLVFFWYFYKTNTQLFMTESQIQAVCFKWFHNTHCLEHHSPRCIIFSVPNGGTRNPLEAITLSSTGLLPGVSDLIILTPNRILFIEVKTEAGTQSGAQKSFEARLKTLGYSYYLVRSLDEFKEVVLNNL